MTRKQKIVSLLKKHPNGLKLKEIVSILFDKDSSDKRWSNYIGTYHCLRDNRDIFLRSKPGVYTYAPCSHLSINSQTDDFEEIVRSVFKEGEKLRCNEVCQRVLQANIAMGYKTVFHVLNYSGSFLKEGLFYKALD